MVADERHKSAPFECRGSNGFTAPLDELQLLMLGIANRHDHAAAFSELGEKRLRNRGSRGRDEDCVKRREVRHTQRAVPAMYVDVCITKPLQARRRRKCQLGSSLHAKHFSGQAREDRGLITATSADLEDAITRLYTQCYCHRSDDVWLRNSLAVADGQG